MAQNDQQRAVIAHAQNDMANLPPGVSVTPAEPVKAASPKIGEGHLKAMVRLGGHELTNALAAFPDSNIRPMEEPGVFGNENAPQYAPDKGQEYDPSDFARSGGGSAPDRSRGR